MPSVHLLELGDTFYQAYGQAVGDLGFSDAALARACEEAGLDLLETRLLADDAPRDWVVAWQEQMDRRLLADVELPPNGRTARIRGLVQRRLENLQPEYLAVQRFHAILLRPAFALTAVETRWRMADALWKHAGDQAVGLDYHSKRASLAAIYAVTEHAWLGLMVREGRKNQAHETQKDAWPAITNQSMEFFDRCMRDVRRLSGYRAGLQSCVARLNPFRHYTRAA